MGWSCSAKASFVRSALAGLIGGPTSNGLPGGAGFWETSRTEHADGAITGSVWKMLPDGIHARRAGSFRITGEGKIARFPLIPAAMKAAAEAKGAAEFARVYPDFAN